MKEREEKWEIDISGDSFTFKRVINGRVEESYAAVNTAKAAIYANAIIHGFQPPRDLRSFDKLTG